MTVSAENLLSGPEIEFLFTPEEDDKEKEDDDGGDQPGCSEWETAHSPIRSDRNIIVSAVALSDKIPLTRRNRLRLEPVWTACQSVPDLSSEWSMVGSQQAAPTLFS